MEFYGATFFCEEPVYCHVRQDDKDAMWTVMVTINSSIDGRHTNPQVTFHMENLTQLIAFKNSVIGAVDAIMEGDSNVL
jgi:hypothetical protein